jgi:hypothetical protein
MDRSDRQETEGTTSDGGKLSEKGEEARKELDEIPPPGTDPLHEGP